MHGRTLLGGLVLATSLRWIVGCTGETASEPRPSWLEGTAAGVSFQPQDAAFVYSSSDTAELLILVLTDLPDACAALGDGRIDAEVFEVPLRAPDAHLLAWSVTGRLGDPAPDIIGPATVPASFGGFGPSGQVNAYPTLRWTDASCDSQTAAWDPESSGELVIETLSLAPGGRMVGAFEIRQSAETLQGSFDAELCELPASVPRPACPY